MRGVLAPVALVALAQALGAQRTLPPEGEWYRSNALGALVERIEWFRRSEFEYTARVLRREGGQTIQLWRGSTLEETRLHDLDEAGKVRRVRVIRQGRTMDAYDLDEAARLTREEVWIEGRLRSRIVYRWEEDRLIQRQFYRPDGRLLFTDLIERTPAGRIRRVTRRYPGGLEWHSWNWGSQGLGSEIGQEGEEVFFSAYGDHSRVRLRELSVGGRIFQVSQFEWEVDQIRTRLDRWVGRQYEEFRRFDDRGNPILYEVREAGRLLAQERSRYDTEDRLVEREKVQDGSREVVRYVYDEEGRLERQETERDGSRESIFWYEGGQLKREEFFFEGRPVVVNHWENGVKVKEVFFDATGRPRERLRGASP